MRLHHEYLRWLYKGGRPNRFARWQKRPHIPVDRHAPDVEFERVAAQIPVFRIEPAPSALKTAGLNGSA